jgi:hypothetical protein
MIGFSFVLARDDAERHMHMTRWTTSVASVELFVVDHKERAPGAGAGIALLINLWVAS